MDEPTPTPTDSPPRVPRRSHHRPPQQPSSSTSHQRLRCSTQRRRQRVTTSSSDQNIEGRVQVARPRRRTNSNRPRSIAIDLNVRHRSILANSEYNLESGGDANSQASEYHSDPIYCRRSRSSQSSADLYPPPPGLLYPRTPTNRRHDSSDDSSSVSSHRKARPRTLDLQRIRDNLSTEEDNSPYSPGAGSCRLPNPLPSLDASPDKSASGVRKMYLETKINMLEIIQAGLQLKLDMQCVREQFLSLLETYTYMEDKFLLRPSQTFAPPRSHSSPTIDKPISAGRARVRALYEARRARIQARRARFAKEMAAGATPVSTRQQPPSPQPIDSAVEEPPRLRSRRRMASHRVFTATSSEAMSDSTMDEWELKSVSSCSVVDSQDCSKHRHNNSPSSEGVVLTSSTSPDSDIPLGGTANMSCGAGNSSSTSSSDGTGLITKLTKSVTVHDKENQKPLCEDARNNNLVNGVHVDQLSRGSGGSGASTSKLAPIREEYNTDSNGNSPHNRTLTSIQGDIKSFCAQDMEPDDNDYVQMTGIDPSIMDYNGGNMSHFGCAGEAMQSRISGFSDLTQELPRTCQSSYNFPNPSFGDTSIPIYSVKNKKDIEGEYVTLASPFPTREVGDYVTLKAPEANSMMSFFESNLEPSMMLEHNMTKPPWSITSLNMTENFGPHNIINSSAQLFNTSKKEGPVKYATSDMIRQLYTKSSPKPACKSSSVASSRSLRDISNISRISKAELSVGISDSTIGSMLDFGSPDVYPLNSTMKSASQLQHQLQHQQTASEDTDDTLENITDETLESVPEVPPRQSFDNRTSYSDSAVLRAPNATQLSLHSAQSKDDSFIINSYQPEPEPSVTTDLSQYQSEDFVTPKRTMSTKPQLCKEHGVHPTFGGPCIFEDSFDVLDSSTESEEEDIRSSSRRSRRGVNYSATDTDCDSSYLSECVDDTHFTSDFGGKLDQYTYDARNGRMMRRQTGQADIKRVKNPIGLSESDLHFNVTRKHLSLEATRSSLPDLANLSVPTSECDDQDSTLKLEDIKEDHVDTNLDIIKQLQSQGRPLSIATVTTTTDESPESNPGFPVPVNSPNVTSQESSSSRPTTDNYDYVDIPRDMIPKDTFKMPPPRQLPPRRKPGVGSSRAGCVPGPPSRRPKQMGAYGGSVGSLQPPPVHSVSRHKPVYRSDAGSLGDTYSGGGHTSYSGGGHTSYSGGGHTSYSGDGHKPRSRSRHRYQSHSSTDHSQDRPDSRSYVQGRHFEISDTSGVKRTVVQHSAVARNLSKDRKKVLAKKLKQFSNNFYNSTGNLQIKTLGHF